MRHSVHVTQRNACFPAANVAKVYGSYLSSRCNVTRCFYVDTVPGWYSYATPYSTIHTYDTRGWYQVSCNLDMCYIRPASNELVLFRYSSSCYCWCLLLTRLLTQPLITLTTTCYHTSTTCTHCNPSAVKAHLGLFVCGLQRRGAIIAS